VYLPPRTPVTLRARTSKCGQVLRASCTICTHPLLDTHSEFQLGLAGLTLLPPDDSVTLLRTLVARQFSPPETSAVFARYYSIRGVSYVSPCAADLKIAGRLYNHSRLL
jgi:hypothetical protein